MGEEQAQDVVEGWEPVAAVVPGFVRNEEMGKI